MPEPDVLNILERALTVLVGVVAWGLLLPGLIVSLVKRPARLRRAQAGWVPEGGTRSGSSRQMR